MKVCVAKMKKIESLPPDNDDDKSNDIFMLMLKMMMAMVMMIIMMMEMENLGSLPNPSTSSGQARVQHWHVWGAK